MNKKFILLSFFMGVVVLSSNFLVQFPVNYYGLNELLTYGAFSYPIAFLITDLANRSYGKIVARKIVYLGFILGVAFTILFSSRNSTTCFAISPFLGIAMIAKNHLQMKNFLSTIVIQCTVWKLIVNFVHISLLIGFSKFIKRRNMV